MVKLPLLAILIFLSFLQQGCAPLVAGGAVATSVIVAKDPRTAGTIIDDKGIQMKAGNELYEDEMLGDQVHINVASYNGVVLLTGETPTAEMRARAEQIVSEVDKVRRVHNEITVAAPSSGLTRSSDTLITTKIKTRMVAEKEFDSGRIKVVTENGTVYLMGLVTRQQAAVATEISRSVSGVQRVVRLFEYTD
ncbi:MAG: BON domain-containing protein [Gammaproteobacteria bacterium]|nr:BON domain-containing protein [Gammaproteobacteria bacterium]MDJ0891274.1 BON domain-containing protein [Gammaproteobacteria bacterium]